ncbi:MAG: hypothetical protein JWN76_2303 [Chitinophagaceae bacterium]|nr:hypothetical protein [Chitinophagaceae bacterium]
MAHRKPYLLSVLTNRCPRCREGALFQSKSAFDFKNFMKMNEHCPVCGQPTEIEVGFYYGTGYVSYALCVAFTVAFFLLWYIIIGFSINDNRVFWCLGADIFLMVIAQTPLMRLSRSIWISWFVKYDPDWKNHPLKEPERVVKEHMQNW